jgi:hypothetical protein
MRTPGETDDVGGGHDRGRPMTRTSDRVMVVTAHPDDPEVRAARSPSSPRKGAR